jgi:hypothetical protein
MTAAPRGRHVLSTSAPRLRSAAGQLRWLTTRATASAALALAERLNHTNYVGLDYPTSADNDPRYGHGRRPHTQLEALLRRHEDAYSDALHTILRQEAALRRIPRHPGDETEPFWINGMLPGLDAAAIYAFLREWRPRRYIEIGAGHSTKFASRARRDAQSEIELIAIDPHPRQDIDHLCDRIIAQPLESTDLTIFSEAQPGDVIFFDGSHRAFMNSDVTVFFLEVLPRLPGGVIVGIHDIYLPYDYPPDIRDRYYSEQYLLACWLLAGERLQPILPAAYIQGASARILSSLWNADELEGVESHGAGFWCRTTTSEAP